MFDLFPIESYSSIYYNLQLVVVVLTVLHTQLFDYRDKSTHIYLAIIGWPYAILITLYLGLRPVSGEFVDMTTYAYMFYRETIGNPVEIGSDIAFAYLLKFSARFTTEMGFFFICALLYVGSLIIASKNLFKNYWIYGFIAIVASFSFYAYGVNGIRNGMATSIFIWGISYPKKPLISALIIAIACLFHQSMYLPTAAYVITYLVNKPKMYLIGWFAAIPLSLVFGSLFVGLFSGLGFADDRLSEYLLSEANANEFSSTGFRWDFLIYGATGTFAGWYFIFKRQFKDPFYNRIYGTFLIANAFWILVITANFSNRFAYLSWFLLALVIFYPFLKKRFFSYQHQIFGAVLLLYFMFTYTMNLLIPNI